MSLNEADTCAKLIDPRLHAFDWTSSQITCEYYLRSDWEFIAVSIVLRGDQAERLLPRRSYELQVRMSVTGIDAPNDQ